jgi:Ca-activated chloride channel homolog
MNMIKHSVIGGFALAMSITALAIAFAHPFDPQPTGTLEVTVVDSASSKPLLRASVHLVETRQGAYTSSKGLATVRNVQVGTYTVVVKYAGYTPQTKTNLRIDSGRTTTLQIALSRSNPDTILVQSQKLVDISVHAAGAYSIHGSRGDQNSIRFNGIETNPIHSGSTSATQSSAAPLAISEVNVTTAGGDASKGGYIGGEINSNQIRSKRTSGFASFSDAPPPPTTSDYNTAEYTNFQENEFKDVLQEPLSTFSIDVDGASYSNLRHFLTSGQMPPPDAVRIEEMINYFKYDYPQPTKADPFSITTELGPCPWKTSHRLVLVGLQGKEIPKDQAPPANLTFLLDVSGSMSPQERLPLLQKAFRLLVNELRPQDRVAFVTYAGNAGLVLAPTTGEHKDLIFQALDRLDAGGSTAGGAGIALAYNTAKQNFNSEYNNRVILATDGDFNVGISNTGDLVRYIEAQRASGIYLTTIGVGTNNYKDARLKELADKGNGNYYYLDNILEAKKVFVTQMGGTLNAIAKDVKIQIEFNPLYVQGYRLLGYESRILLKEDFNNDKKDAGELGSGHTVTALYEIIPAATDAVELHSVDSLRYQRTPKPVLSNSGTEMMMVKFRYKRPTDSTSRLIEHPLAAEHPEIDHDSHIHRGGIGNLAWATAVTEFGMVLRDSKFKGASTLTEALAIAKRARGTDAEGYRAEFIKLVELSQLLNKASK